MHVGLDKYKYLLTLYKNNSEGLTKFFGKPKTVANHAGQALLVWETNFADKLFKITYSARRGTKYEIEHDGDYDSFFDDDGIGQICCDFLEHIYNLLYGDSNGNETLQP